MKNIQINTVTKWLLIAQNYSSAAKREYMDETDLHYKKINQIIEDAKDYDQMVEDLYYEKNVYLNKAMKSAKRAKIKVYYDENEQCLYFEMPYGQCSFHCFDEFFITENVVITEDYAWSGLHNTRSLLLDNYATA